MKILHLSDTHLGYNDFDRVGADGVNVREQDFYDSLSRVVTRAIEIKPDAVIHTGDFFHRPSPANRPMIQGLMELKRLTSQGIPFIIIAGNHSTPRTFFTSPILRAFRSIDNVHPFFDQKYGRMEIGDMVFHGIPHMNDDSAFDEEIRRAEPAEGKANILMLHASVGRDYIMEEYGERVFPSDRNSIFGGFNYTALGHWHNFQQVRIKGNVWYSGSTERLSDRESGREKGFIVTEFHDNGAVSAEFERLPARPWLRFDIKDSWEKSVSDIIKEVKGCAEPGGVPEGAIVSIYFHNLDPRQGIEISNSSLAEIFSGALTVQVRRIFRKGDAGMASMEMESESLDQLFRDYLERTVDDKPESDRMYSLAMKYFEKYDRDGQ